jgi:hypothetical protein
LHSKLGADYKRKYSSLEFFLLDSQTDTCVQTNNAILRGVSPRHPETDNASTSSWPGSPRPSTSCLLQLPKDVDARDKRAFTPVFDGLCAGMTTLREIRQVSVFLFQHVARLERSENRDAARLSGGPGLRFAPSGLLSLRSAETTMKTTRAAGTTSSIQPHAEERSKAARLEAQATI